MAMQGVNEKFADFWQAVLSHRCLSAVLKNGYLSEIPAKFYDYCKSVYKQ